MPAPVSTLVILCLAVASALASPDGAAWGMPGRAAAIRFRAPMRTGWVEGEFRRWRLLRALIDDERPENSAVDVAIELDSLTTGDEHRDRQLRGPAPFDVRRRPEAVVHLRSARVEDGAHFVVTAVIEVGGRVHSAPIRFTLLDAVERRIAGGLTLPCDALGLAALGCGPAPLAIMIDAVVPPAADGLALSSPDRRPAGIFGSGTFAS